MRVIVIIVALATLTACGDRQLWTEDEIRDIAGDVSEDSYQGGENSERIDDLESQLSDMETRLDAAESENADLRSEIDSLRSDMAWQ